MGFTLVENGGEGVNVGNPNIFNGSGVFKVACDVDGGEDLGDEGGHEGGHDGHYGHYMVIMTVNLRNPNIFNSSETLNVKNEGSFKQR